MQQAEQLERNVKSYCDELTVVIGSLKEGDVDNYIVKHIVNQTGTQVQDVNPKLNILLLESVKAALTTFVKEYDDNKVIDIFRLVGYGGKPCFSITKGKLEFDTTLLGKIYQNISTANLIGTINEILRKLSGAKNEFLSVFSNAKEAEELLTAELKRKFIGHDFIIKETPRGYQFQYLELDKLTNKLRKPTKKLGDILALLSKLEGQIVEAELQLYAKKRNC